MQDGWSKSSSCEVHEVTTISAREELLGWKVKCVFSLPSRPPSHPLSPSLNPLFLSTASRSHSWSIYPSIHPSWTILRGYDHPSWWSIHASQRMRRRWKTSCRNSSRQFLVPKVSFRFRRKKKKKKCGEEEEIRRKWARDHSKLLNSSSQR